MTRVVTRTQTKTELLKVGIPEKYHELFLKYVNVDVYLKSRLLAELTNVSLILTEVTPHSIKNEIIADLLRTKVEHVIEHGIMGLYEIVEIHLNKKDPQFADLKIMRDKLIAHKNEVHSSSEQKDYGEWYIKKYGSYGSVLAFIEKQRVLIQTVFAPLLDQKVLEFTKGLGAQGLSIVQGDVICYQPGQIKDIICKT